MSDGDSLHLGGGMDQHEHNREVFDSSPVTRSYERAHRGAVAFLDAGERVALVGVASQCRGAPVLDVGVGAGRTAPLLLMLSDDYVAVDYSPTMLAVFRGNYPDVDARVTDARDLSEFDDGHFGLVYFSNNGIDTLDHEDRSGALAEFRRVTRSGGRIVFSTLNRDGKSFGEHPFQVIRPGARLDPRGLARRIIGRVLDPPSIGRSVNNWRRGRRRQQDCGDWAIGPLAFHDFAPFVHFTTLPDLRRALAEAQLTAEAVYDENGQLVDLDAPACTVDHFTVVARAA